MRRKPPRGVFIGRYVRSRVKYWLLRLVRWLVLLEMDDSGIDLNSPISSAVELTACASLPSFDGKLIHCCATSFSFVWNYSVRRRRKNIDSSSKSNPLRRRRKKIQNVDELSIKILAIYLQQ